MERHPEGRQDPDVTSDPDETPLFSGVASEPPGKSVAAEQQAVGDGEDTEDTGDAVPTDDAQ